MALFSEEIVDLKAFPDIREVIDFLNLANAQFLQAILVAQGFEISNDLAFAGGGPTRNNQDILFRKWIHSEFHITKNGFFSEVDVMGQ